MKNIAIENGGLQRASISKGMGWRAGNGRAVTFRLIPEKNHYKSSVKQNLIQQTEP